MLCFFRFLLYDDVEDDDTVRIVFVTFLKTNGDKDDDDAVDLPLQLSIEPRLLLLLMGDNDDDNLSGSH